MCALGFENEPHSTSKTPWQTNVTQQVEWKKMSQFVQKTQKFYLMPIKEGMRNLVLYIQNLNGNVTHKPQVIVVFDIK